MRSNSGTIASENNAFSREIGRLSRSIILCGNTSPIPTLPPHNFSFHSSSSLNNQLTFDAGTSPTTRLPDIPRRLSFACFPTHTAAHTTPAISRRPISPFRRIALSFLPPSFSRSSAPAFQTSPDACDINGYHANHIIYLFSSCLILLLNDECSPPLHLLEKNRP